MQVVLSPEAISQLHTPTPSVFVSLHYADYETQVTPVKQGARFKLHEYYYTAMHSMYCVRAVVGVHDLLLFPLVVKGHELAQQLLHSSIENSAH